VRPVVLTIAGSDSSAGAGIQADLKAIEANLGWAATVIAAVTAQGPRGVRDVHAVPLAAVEAQLRAVLEELPVAAVKTGMLVGAPTVELVAGVLREHEVPFLVCDPVLAATSGAALLDAAGRRAFLGLLLPLATLVSPNAVEAELLSGVPVRDLGGAERAGRAMLAAGARAVLVKGGHLGPPDRASDLLVEANRVTLMRGVALEGVEAHGTGCVLASAIATWLARGRDLVEAVTLAKQHVAAAMRHGFPQGSGQAVDPLYSLHDPGGSGRTG
jgi:hydroxymethylpyrimidine/phosphomethylpyrimidine kinase